MARYVISDHHFGHENIIEYTDRPFSSAADMDQSMLNAYYETVQEDDAVTLYLGDVAMDMNDGRETIEYVEKLDANLLIRGNHDVGLDPGQASFPVLESCTIEHGDYTFLLTHRPEDVPEDWEQWAIHGHHHNNHPDEHPFVHAGEKRVNVSVELLDYEPIALDELTDILDACDPGERIRDIDTARDELL